MKSIKNIFNFKLFAVILSLVVLVGCGSSDSEDASSSGSESSDNGQDEQITLTYASSFSENHYIGVVNTEMFKRIEEETNGKVTFNTFYDGTLASPIDWYQELIQGTADMIEAPIGIEQDRFRLEYATAMFNYGITDLYDLLEFTRNLSEEMPELKEIYEEVVPFSRQTAGLAYIHTNDKPIRTAEDFKGMNLKVADDASVELAKALGANPVRLPIAETYTALEKGTIDGVITGGDPLKTFNFAEVTKYTTELPYATPPIYSHFMTKELYESLPEDVQQSLYENGLRWEEEVIDALLQEVAEGIQMAEERGNEIIKLSDEETEKILNVMEENALKLAEQLDSEGYNGTELFNAAREIADQLINN